MAEINAFAHDVCFGVAVLVHLLLLENVLDGGQVAQHRDSVAPVGDLARLHDVYVLELRGGQLVLVTQVLPLLDF